MRGVRPKTEIQRAPVMWSELREWCGRTLAGPYRHSRGYVFGLLIFTSALVVRILALLLGADHHGLEQMFSLTPDSVNYLTAAKTLLSGGYLAHQKELFYFPIGYSGLVAANLFIAGNNPLPLLLLQVLLSAATCLIVYSLTQLLGLTVRLGITAGLLMSFSITSIALSTLVLSDTVYTFAFATSLWLTVKAASTKNARWLYASGAVCGAAILVRPVGKYWPLALALIAAGIWWIDRFRGIDKPPWGNALSRGTIAMVLVAFLLPLTWVVRNDYVHGLPVLAITTISAPATVAAKTMGNLENRDYRLVQEDWERQYITSHLHDSDLLEGLCRQAQLNSQEVIDNHPVEFVKVYAAWSWENVNEPDYLLPVVIPALGDIAGKITGYLRAHGLLKLRFYLAVTGLLILVVGRCWKVATVLSVAYAYCAITIGAFPYQGSRYFLPGQVVGWILVATILTFSIDALTGAFRRLKGK